MRKILKGSSFIIICISILIIFSFSLVISIEKIEQTYGDFNNQNTSNKINIVAPNLEDAYKYNKKVYLDFYDEIKNKEDVIIKFYGLDVGFENAPNNLGLYFNGEINTSYNLMEGRFFSKDDFKSNEKLVVIGKDILEKCIDENGEKYLINEGDTFKVIGVIGRENYTTQYDDMIIYNLNTLINKIRLIENGEWVLDSLVHSKEELSNYVYECDESKELIPYVPEINETSLELSINNNKDIVISFMLIIITISLGLVQAIVYWSNGLTLEIGVRKSFGATRANILINVLKRYYLISFLAAIITVVITKGISIIFKVDTSINLFSVTNIINLIILLIAFGIVPIVSIEYNMKKYTIIEMLKE